MWAHIQQQSSRQIFPKICKEYAKAAFLIIVMLQICIDVLDFIGRVAKEKVPTLCGNWWDRETAQLLF